MVTQKEVKKIATLCKLTLKKREVELFAKLFSATLDVVNILNELDLSQVGETYQVTGLTNVFMKDDENVATLSQKEALKNAKEKSRDLFVTQGAFDR